MHAQVEVLVLPEKMIVKVVILGVLGSRSKSQVYLRLIEVLAVKGT